MNAAWFGLLVIPALLILWAGYLWGHRNVCPPSSPASPYFQVRLTLPRGVSSTDPNRLKAYTEERARGLVHKPETVAEMKRIDKALRAEMAKVFTPNSRYVRWLQGGQSITWTSSK